MPARPNSRKWNDVQTAIATAAIVGTLGLWNLFATASKVETAQAGEPVVPAPTQSPEEDAPVVMPQVKIMFTQTASQTTTVQQQVQTTRKKKKDKDNGSGSVSVTQTKTS